jgi:hypothetical protein
MQLTFGLPVNLLIIHNEEIQHLRNHCVQDPNHLFNNAPTTGLARAGKAACMKAFASVANIGHGPHWKGQFATEIQEAGIDIAANLSENSPLLLRFWKSICQDRRWYTEEASNAAARRRFLDQLPNSQVSPLRCLHLRFTCLTL